MRIKHLFFMAVTAAFAFTACDDPANGDDPVNGDANFWATYQLAPKGVKSMTSSLSMRAIIPTYSKTSTSSSAPSPIRPTDSSIHTLRDSIVGMKIILVS